MTPTDSLPWKDILDWYHNVLRLVRSAIENRQEIDAVLFRYYGPRDYEPEREELYEKRLSLIPSHKVLFIRLRIHVSDKERKEIIQEISQLARALF